MSALSGSALAARALRRQGVDTVFYLMGGPMMDVLGGCIACDMRMVDVRHEQAAAMMAHAYARLLNRPGVCVACSGPGVTNLVTGVATAFADRVPLVALGGSSPAAQAGRGVFQELDQVSMMRPITKWAERVPHPSRIPELIETAFREAQSGQPGPVYLDLPGDVLYQQVEDAEARLAACRPWRRGRPRGDPGLVEEAAGLLAAAERPIVLSGSGVFWSDAAAQLQAVAELLDAPVYTTPQGRGAIPEDHRLSLLHVRSTAFREADAVLVVGTRANYVVGHLSPPRFDPAARIVRVDVDAAELGRGRPAEVAIQGDAAAVLGQLLEAGAGRSRRASSRAWLEALTARNAAARAEQEEAIATDQVPIHPLRLCREVRDFLDRDAVLVVDGQDILTFGRQTIPTYVPRHRLNSGTFGTMGVGLPFGLGAKVARPDRQVLVLHGDGSFGMNGLELDTAIRHGLAVTTVISNNGGWTADPERSKPGRDLGYTRFDRVAAALGCHAEQVEEPGRIRGALERAAASGGPAVVNVVTDFRARSSTTTFASYTT